MVAPLIVPNKADRRPQVLSHMSRYTTIHARTLTRYLAAIIK